LLWRTNAVDTQIPAFFTVLFAVSFHLMGEERKRRRSASAYWRFVRRVLRRHPFSVSVLVLMSLVVASDFGGLTLLVVFFLCLPIVGIAGGARQRIPVRDFVQYIAIALLLVTGICVLEYFKIGFTGLTSPISLVTELLV